MTGKQPPERPAGEVERPGDIVQVTAGCGLDWTGPRHAWDVWFSDRHAWAHNKGRDGLSACCPGTTTTLIEPGPDPAQQPKADRDAAATGRRVSISQPRPADPATAPAGMPPQAARQAELEADV